MHEYVPPDPDEAQLAKNYASIQGVKMRWEYYKLGEKHEDLDELIISTLLATGFLPTHEKPVIETGPAAGDLLGEMVLRGLASRVKGIEKHSGVLKDAFDLDVTPEELRKFLEKAETRGWQLGIDPESEGIQKKVGSYNERRQLIKGSAHDLSEHKDGDTKLFLALYMLYHLSEKERAQALKEIYRILEYEGIAVIATSGNQIDGTGNKDGLHRLEQMTADVTDSIAPPPMNEGFPGNKATEQLSKQFPYVYYYEYTDEVILKYGETAEEFVEAERRLDIYMDSLRSLKNQFKPEPSDKLFESVIEAIIKPMIRQQMWMPGGYTDNICRVIYLCSKKEIPGLIDLPAKGTQKFQHIKSKTVGE